MPDAGWLFFQGSKVILHILKSKRNLIGSQSNRFRIRVELLKRGALVTTLARQLQIVLIRTTFRVNPFWFVLILVHYSYFYLILCYSLFERIYFIWFVFNKLSMIRVHIRIAHIASILTKSPQCDWGIRTLKRYRPNKLPIKLANSTTFVTSQLFK